MKKRILVAALFAAVVGFCALQKVGAKGQAGIEGRAGMQKQMLEGGYINNLSLSELQQSRDKYARIIQNRFDPCFEKKCRLQRKPGYQMDPTEQVYRDGIKRIDAKIAELQ